MKTTKKERHEMIRERARDALRNLYHNATPEHARNVPDKRQDLYQSWFEDAAHAEIDYLRDGGAYGGTRKSYRKILEENAAHKLKSERARAYYVRKGMRDMNRERERCNKLDSREHATNALWERISEFGTLYQFGRGGRTLAPEQLVRMRGGSSFSIKEDAFDDYPIEACVDSLRILESFNRYVESWCEGIPEMWREYLSECVDEEEREENEDAFHD